MSEESGAGAPDNSPCDDNGFVAAVMKSVTALGVKPRCVVCSNVGWAKFNLVPMPMMLPALAAGEAMQAAAFVCLKCGHISFHNLEGIGVSMQVEDSSGLVDPDGRPAHAGASRLVL